MVVPTLWGDGKTGMLLLGVMVLRKRWQPFCGPWWMGTILGNVITKSRNQEGPKGRPELRDPLSLVVLGSEPSGVCTRPGGKPISAKVSRLFLAW